MKIRIALAAAKNTDGKKKDLKQCLDEVEIKDAENSKASKTNGKAESIKDAFKR